MSKAKESSIGLSYPMLTRNNYTAWSLKMKVFMKAQGVWSAIENESKTTVDDKTVQVALAAIYQGVPEDVLLAIAEKETAKEAWEAIRTFCMGAERVKEAKVQTLKGEFESLVMKETDQVDDFCIKLSGIVTNIRVLGETMEESSVVRKILRAVPEKFLQIASNIEQFGDVKGMTVEEVVGRLKAHEERMKGRSENTGGQLLLTQEEWAKRSNKQGSTTSQNQRPRGGFGARGRGWHNSKNHSGGTRQYQQQQNKHGGTSKEPTGTRDRSTVKCFNCNVYGHYAVKCRKPKREREWNKEQTQESNLMKFEDEEPSILLTEREQGNGDVVLLNEEKVKPSFDQLEGTKGDKSIWYLDNGASNHMIGHREKFNELNEDITDQVQFGDGSTVKIEGKGMIVFKCKNGEEHTLKEVYFIPTLCSNIISLG
ncbi:uncharacterized protein LOC141659884 [Apium graveolens]|uniref:uncharacterized protein LOC141659884 n=1 Tax=Apium graveolens TaxID=4045 RepID=UPI003D78FF1C